MNSTSTQASSLSPSSSRSESHTYVTCITCHISYITHHIIYYIIYHAVYHIVVPYRELPPLGSIPPGVEYIPHWTYYIANSIQYSTSCMAHSIQYIVCIPPGALKKQYVAQVGDAKPLQGTDGNTRYLLATTPGHARRQQTWLAIMCVCARVRNMSGPWQTAIAGT